VPMTSCIMLMTGTVYMHGLPGKHFAVQLTRHP
jgi:hypothetical protein